VTRAPATLSVIICTWNRADTLRETLDSLSRQQGVDPAGVEVIVVDNNSSDHTGQTVEAASAAWPLGTLRYAFEPRQGKQFALNQGVGLASHEILAFTDDDIQFPTDWLCNVLQVVADEGVDLAGGKTLIRWPAAGKPNWYADDMLAIVGGVDLGDRRLDPSPKDYGPAGANLIARRSLFGRVGGYSEVHFRHMDHEFGLRCQARGIRVVYDPRLVVHAPVDEACLTPRYFRRWSFKAGITRSGGVEAKRERLPRVQPWIYRQAMEDAVIVALGRLRPSTPHSFSRELRLWRAWGTIANAWHAWLRPGRHADWVEQRSEKRNNRY
jgi:glycosyltransferase involved in cell wall biosynthesis